MTMSAVAVPGADQEGFQHLTQLRKAVRGLELAQYLERYPAPALLVVGLGSVDSHAGDDALGSNLAPQLLTITHKGLSALRYLDRLGFLVKRPGNPFPHFISLGRAANNDLVISIDSVSKVHGYFINTGDGWAFTDHGSTNGTSINGRPLQGAVRQPLADGDQLQFGPGITVEFLLPETLFRRLHSV